MLTTSQQSVEINAFVVTRLSLFIIIVSENVNNSCSLIKLRPYSAKVIVAIICPGYSLMRWMMMIRRVNAFSICHGVTGRQHFVLCDYQ